MGVQSRPAPTWGHFESALGKLLQCQCRMSNTRSSLLCAGPTCAFDSLLSGVLVFLHDASGCCELERYQYLQDCIALMDSCRAIHSSREPDERISWCALQRGRLRKRQVVNRWPTCRIQQILSSVRLAGDDYENIAAPRPRANNMSSPKAFPRATYLAQDVYLASPCWV